ncbi:MAG: hypothetical protein N2489_09230 [Clostridia bacterium]|nr:hypothetical protein [Clostridia bacterium]
MSNTIAINTKSIPNAVMDKHCLTLLSCVAKFFEDPKNNAAYIEWHKEKYGRMPEEAKKCIKK